MYPISTLLVVFSISALSTFLVRRYYYRLKLIAEPDHRSLHEGEVPHGGGLGFTLAILLAFPILDWMGYLLTATTDGILFAGGILAVIGLYDDVFHIRARYRFLAQALLIILGYYLVLPTDYPLGAYQVGIGVVFLICGLWWVNLFNFMDGSDGLAGSEAMFVLLSASFLLWFVASPEGVSETMKVILIVVTAVAAFMLFNWPSASIFMGDTGSNFLSFTILMIAFQTIVNDQLTIWVWLIISGVFCVDSTVTLITRAMTGQRWYMPHKRHAYQKLIRKMNAEHSISRSRSHLLVMLGTLLVNVVWLLPVAWFAVEYPSYGFLLCVLAYLPLFFYAFSMRAGR